MTVSIRAVTTETTSIRCSLGRSAGLDLTGLPLLLLPRATLQAFSSSRWTVVVSWDTATC